MEGFSQAAANNKAPILAALTAWLAADARVLEIGSGAGQHAIHMAAALPHLHWQPSDQAEALPTLMKNLKAYGSANIAPPICLDLSLIEWPGNPVDCIYSANVVHIVSQTLGEKLIRGAAKLLLPGGLLALYGPFKYRGEFTTSSNADFDLWLKARDSLSGVRDFEWVDDVAQDAGLTFVEDLSMPANNRFLAFTRDI